MLDRLLVDIHEHLVAEDTLDVADGIFGERSRPGIAKPIAGQVILCDFSDRAHAIFAGIFEIIESGLELAAALLFGGFGQGLGTGFASFADAPVREPEFVPPNVAAFE